MIIRFLRYKIISVQHVVYTQKWNTLFRKYQTSWNPSDYVSRNIFFGNCSPTESHKRFPFNSADAYIFYGVIMSITYTCTIGKLPVFSQATGHRWIFANNKFLKGCLAMNSSRKFR